MLINLNSRRSGRNHAFTLVELLLAVSLMLLVSGAVICNFGTLDRGARLEEGSTQTELVLRFARAQAASTGRKVKVVFGDGDVFCRPANPSGRGCGALVEFVRLVQRFR